MAKNHWPGSMVRVSVQMVPGGPHFTILPPTASAMSVTVQSGEFEGPQGVTWVLWLEWFKVLLMEVAETKTLAWRRVAKDLETEEFVRVNVLGNGKADMEVKWF